MFWLSKIASLGIKTSPIAHVHSRNYLGWKHVVAVQRCYSSVRDKGGGKNCDKPPRTVPKDCKPKDKHPCAKPPSGEGKGIPQLPLQDCPPPSHMDDCPKPECAWDVKAAEKRRKARNILILGVLVALASIGALLYFGIIKKKGQKDKARPSKKIKRPADIVKIPSTAKDIPSSVPYLLIGGGTASFSAFRAIKSIDPVAKVLVVTSEGNYPYMRPPLSKEMWFTEDEGAIKKLNFKQWNGSERSLFYEPDDFYTACKDLVASANGGVAVARGWTVTHIDVVKRIAYLEGGHEVKYDKCLIATGALPRNLDIFENASEKVQDRVTLYRNIFDFQELNDIMNDAKDVAIVGGGFLGSELACALARKSKKKVRVHQVFREGGNMGKILPEYLSYWTTEKVKAEGVNVMANTDIISVKEGDGGKVSIMLSTGKTLLANQVIVAVGAEPNTEMAEMSDLEIDPELGGFLVNTELQARSHLFIAGDCACFYDTKLGRRRVEHHDHAVVSGRLAGENMTGSGKPYLHQSMFWSDLGPDVGYEAIGIVDSSLPTVGVFAKATDKDNPKAVVTQTGEGLRSETELPPEVCKKYIKLDPEYEKQLIEERKAASREQQGENFGKGVIFYLRDDIVVGIVLWNVFNRMSVARQVLKDERKYDDLNEVAKLFNIHEE